MAAAAVAGELSAGSRSFLPSAGWLFPGREEREYGKVWKVRCAVQWRCGVEDWRRPQGSLDEFTAAEKDPCRVLKRGLRRKREEKDRGTRKEAQS